MSEKKTWHGGRQGIYRTTSPCHFIGHRNELWSFSPRVDAIGSRRRGPIRSASRQRNAEPAQNGNVRIEQVYADGHFDLVRAPCPAPSLPRRVYKHIFISWKWLTWEAALVNVPGVDPPCYRCLSRAISAFRARQGYSRRCFVRRCGVFKVGVVLCLWLLYET